MLSPALVLGAVLALMFTPLLQAQEPPVGVKDQLPLRLSTRVPLPLASASRDHSHSGTAAPGGGGQSRRT